MNKKIFIGVFAVLALVQWYVPISAIRSWERVRAEGRTFRFVTEPVDPTDLFRGKYIFLRFRDNLVPVKGLGNIPARSNIYITLGEDSLGFATLKAASMTPPQDGSPYLNARAGWQPDSLRVYVNFPFDTYYLEESKAGDAELAYQEAVEDTTQVAYAVVKILDGTPVLEDVRINDKSILEVVEEMRKTKGRK